MEEITLSAGAQAFGDGNHPTTKGVLAALELIDPAEFSPRKACDMGSGSGIVTFAMLQRFDCPVWAVDIARSAVEILQENAKRNGLQETVVALQADGFDHPEITIAAPFDLLVMNILAEPLVRLAGEAVAHLASEGVLILSGIMRWQEEQIQQSYQSLGLELTARLEVGDWVTQIWQKD
ncbi:MAG: 50S ribosomal protein L11 methyltransferase [Rickettsiales bacterium]